MSFFNYVFRNQSWKKLTHTLSRKLALTLPSVGLPFRSVVVCYYTRRRRCFCHCGSPPHSPLIDFQTSDGFPCLQKLWSTIWQCNLINRCISIDPNAAPSSHSIFSLKCQTQQTLFGSHSSPDKVYTHTYNLRTMKFNHKMQQHARNVYKCTNRSKRSAYRKKKNDSGNMFAA